MTTDAVLEHDPRSDSRWVTVLRSWWDSRTWKDPVRVATTANIATTGLQTVDGVALKIDDRVLRKNQNAGGENGIFVVRPNAWLRALDAKKPGHLRAGTKVYVQEGTANAGKTFKLTTTGTIVLDTTTLTFSEDGGGGGGTAATTTFTPAAGIAATDVQAAIQEVVTDSAAAYQPLDADLTDIAAIADAQGDIIVRGAAGWERLAKSATSTHVLTAGASQPSWAAGTLDTGAAPNALTGSPTLAAWWKADALTPVADSTAVASFTDATGNARHLAQGTGSKQPLYRTAANVPWFGGLPALQFDGTDDTLTNAATGIGAAVAAWSLFHVARVGYVGSALNQAVVCDGSGSANWGTVIESEYFQARAGAAVKVRSGGAASQLGHLSVWVIVYDGTNLVVYENGRLWGLTPCTGTNNLGAIHMSTYNGSAFPFRGEMAEAGIYTAALSNAQRIQLTRHLLNKYSLPGVFG